MRSRLPTRYSCARSTAVPAPASGRCLAPRPTIRTAITSTSTLSRAAITASANRLAVFAPEGNGCPPRSDRLVRAGGLQRLAHEPHAHRLSLDPGERADDLVLL